MKSPVTVNKQLPIYDIYILNEGGIPIIAGCSSSNYCASHEGKHPLHAGFIHAILNFGDEVFSSDIRDLTFKTVKLNFKTVDPYTIIFVNPVGVDDDYIEQKLTEVGNLLVNEYMDRFEDYSFSDKLYHEFMDDIIEMGLIAKDRVKLTRDIFMSQMESNQPEEPVNQSIFTRFKKKFYSLIGN